MEEENVKPKNAMDIAIEELHKERELHPKVETETRHADGKLKKGVVLNPNGRPKGSENFSTMWLRTLEKISKDNSITAEEAEQRILNKLYLRAEAGDYRFIKDVLDRRFGKAKETVEVKAQVENVDLTPEQQAKIRSFFR